MPYRIRSSQGLVPLLSSFGLFQSAVARCSTEIHIPQRFPMIRASMSWQQQFQEIKEVPRLSHGLKQVKGLDLLCRCSRSSLHFSCAETGRCLTIVVVHSAIVIGTMTNEINPGIMNHYLELQVCFKSMLALVSFFMLFPCYFLVCSTNCMMNSPRF